jgi:hypothetical protein
LKVRSSKGDCQLSVSNLVSILDFKKMYIDKIGDATLKPDNIRLFCLGKELKDDLYLYSYDIMDEMAIQAMIKK